MFCRKILLVSILSLAGLQCIAQNSHQDDFRSQVYGFLKPADTILFLYRPELFTKKGFDKFADHLAGMCAEKKVEVYFAQMHKPIPDSVMASVDLICKLNTTEVSDGYLYKAAPGKFRKSYIRGSGGKGFSVLGFSSPAADMPLWKCTCDLMMDMSHDPDKEAAKCIFTRLVHDGIVKQ